MAKSLIEHLAQAVNDHASTGAEIINASLTLVERLYVDQGAAEKDVRGVLKECLDELNKLLPQSDDEK